MMLQILMGFAPDHIFAERFIQIFVTGIILPSSVLIHALSQAGITAFLNVVFFFLCKLLADAQI